jgi:hypothetical protein
MRPAVAQAAEWWQGAVLINYTSRPAPGYLQNDPELKVVGVFISRKAAASKQGVQKQTRQLALQ